VLAGGFVARGRGGPGDGFVDVIEELLARRAAEIERAGLDEMLKHALVDGAAVHARGEVGEVAERAVGVALGDDFLRGGLAHAFDGGQAEANGGFAPIRS